MAESLLLLRIGPEWEKNNQGLAKIKGHMTQIQKAMKVSFLLKVT